MTGTDGDMPWTSRAADALMVSELGENSGAFEMARGVAFLEGERQHVRLAKTQGREQ
jgi:hypothetical protein